MVKLIIIAFGGAIGAVLRYVISEIPYRYIAPMFPYGTLLVNLLGAFFIGMLFELSQRIEIPSEWRIFVFIGIIGAFTTFSTFALESVNLIRDGEYVPALWNIIITNVAGFVLVYAGFVSTRALFRVVHLLK